MKRLLLLAISVVCCSAVFAQEQVSKVWVADNGDGTYKNPILYADYPDPDVIRVGETFYMVSSTFNTVPGLTIMQSADLVNWQIVGSAIARQEPLDVFAKPQHGNGVWAPSLRQHNGEFYIYYGDPDYGIYMVKSKSMTSGWSKPHLVKAGKGLIDPCPLWDNDGRAYLVHGWAGSRAGIKSILTVSEMAPDGKSLIGEERIVFDGHEAHPTVEGPKFYKRNGYYYIFAPAGGVATGWQLALRSKSPFGPYDEKVVLKQGSSKVNGPHQGGWVDDVKGNYWFIHFQDVEELGRITHLQPMKWEQDWPVIGVDTDGDGIGEPVAKYRKPSTLKPVAVATPQTTDEFNAPSAGLQWQWHANPEPTWAFAYNKLGVQRLYCITAPAEAKNMWDIPNLFMQRISAPEMSATTKLSFKALLDGEKVGLIVMGMSYGYVALENRNGSIVLVQASCEGADKGNAEVLSDAVPLANTAYLRVSITQGKFCQFSYSTNGTTFTNIGKPVRFTQGRWIGARVGIFATGKIKKNDVGYADFDWFRVDKPEAN